MRKIFGIFLMILSLMAGQAVAQQTQEISVKFDRNCWFRSHAVSEAFPVSKSDEADFTGVSAYIMQQQVEAQLWYRIHGTKGWEEWKPLHQNHEGETSDRTAYSGDPVQQSFSKIQFKSSDTLPGELVFRLYFAGATEKKSPEITHSKKAGSTCGCPQPTYCDRSCWCPNGNCQQNYTPTPTQSTHLIVHHSAGFNSSNDFAAVVAYYWDLHVNTNGWDDIGYNWLIDANGTIYEGRGSGVTGAHFSCLNSNTTGICMIGNFENANPRLAAKNSLMELLTWEACSQGIAIADSSVHGPSQLLLKHVSGHRDANSATVGCPKGTVCPGGLLYASLDSLSAVVAANPCLFGVGHQKLNNHVLTLYPNPTNGKLWIEGIASGEAIFRDLNGKVILNLDFDERQPIELSALKPGLYLVDVLQNGEYLETVKIMLQP